MATVEVTAVEIAAVQMSQKVIVQPLLVASCG